MSHEIHPRLHKKLTTPHQHYSRTQINVVVIGAGGNGTHMLNGLTSMHKALRAFDFTGLHVTLIDPDTISESNLARQSFYPSDLGLNKATTLINRYNLAHNLTWKAEPRHVTEEDLRNCDIVITCVDNRAARALVHKTVTQSHNFVAYWLDLGNSSNTGQVILGSPHNAVNPRSRTRLRTSAEIWPSIVNTSLPEDDTPSCSTIEALDRQDLFINNTLATTALNMLWQLFRHGTLDHHGAFINTSTSHVTPIYALPELWQRLRRDDQRRHATT